MGPAIADLLLVQPWLGRLDDTLKTRYSKPNCNDFVEAYSASGFGSDVLPREGTRASLPPSMSRLWSARVRDLTPYVPGEQPRIENLVKLNTNENPYGPSPRALAALQRELADSLRRYPDPTALQLRETIARYHSTSLDRVFVGNGSDEVLSHAFVALLNHARPILFPDVTYSFYPVCCKLYGIAWETVPLTDTFEIRADDYLRPNGGIIFANPNAPTGRALPLREVERIAAGNPESAVIVDEAYIDFGGETALGLVDHFDNVLVIQTLSKSRSLAGLRVGFAIGQPPLIDALTRVKDSFNSYPLDRLAISGGVAAFEDTAHFKTTRTNIIASRARLATALAQLGFEIVPSAANFLFVRHPARDAAQLLAELRAHSVLVRHFAQPRIAQFLRITVGTDPECDVLLQALRDIL